MTDEEKKGGLTKEDIAKALKNIEDPGERAEKEQRLRQFNELSMELERGEITEEEFHRRLGPWLDTGEMK